jgi:hypothetical protein
MPEHAVIRILLTGVYSYAALSDRFHIVEGKIGLGTLRKSRYRCGPAVHHVTGVASAGSTASRLTTAAFGKVD